MLQAREWFLYMFMLATDHASIGEKAREEFLLWVLSQM